MRSYRKTRRKTTKTPPLCCRRARTYGSFILVIFIPFIRFLFLKMASSLEEHVLNTYRELSYPPYGHFLRILREEEGINLKLNQFKSMLLKSGVKYPIMANRRVNRPVRRFYASLSPDSTWVRVGMSCPLPPIFCHAPIRIETCKYRRVTCIISSPSRDVRTRASYWSMCFRRTYSPGSCRDLGIRLRTCLGPSSTSSRRRGDFRSWCRYVEACSVL